MKLPRKYKTDLIESCILDTLDGLSIEDAITVLQGYPPNALLDASWVYHDNDSDGRELSVKTIHYTETEEEFAERLRAEERRVTIERKKLAYSKSIGESAKETYRRIKGRQ